MIAPLHDPAIEKTTIMVVEDNVELRFLVSSVLRAEGFRVVEAATTDEAAAFLKTSHGVALVFSDIMLPGEVDGIGFAEMRARDYPGIKVILTSGEVTRDKVPPNLLLMRKPYILARVITEVKRALGMEPEQTPPG